MRLGALLFLVMAIGIAGWWAASDWFVREREYALSDYALSQLGPQYISLCRDEAAKEEIKPELRTLRPSQAWITYAEEFSMSWWLVIGSAWKTAPIYPKLTLRFGKQQESWLCTLQLTPIPTARVSGVVVDAGRD